MALTTVSSERLSTNVKNTNFTAAEKQDLTDDIKPLLGSSGGGNKNLIINGAMNVAQRATSETGVAANGYSTVDRFAMYQSGTDAYPSTAQADIASGTTPYTNGFRKSFKITNGNQTSGGQAADQLYISHKIEAQNMATSGWNYTSASSYVTLSFYVKSSVAQNFYGYLKVNDGTTQNYPFETGSLTADTWTKITKTIPGNSNLQFDTDTEANRIAAGVEFAIGLFFGTDFTGSITLNQWGDWNSSNRAPDYGTSNDDWYETNDATFELTGVQLEVGSQATPFEHRSVGEELQLCKRYYEVLVSGTGIAWGGICAMYTASETHHQCTWVEKRTTPTLTYTTGTNYYRYYGNGTNVTATRPNAMLYASTRSGGIQTNSTYLSGSLLQGGAAFAYSQDASTHVAVDAEL